MIIFPNCKINIGLKVLGKRTDGYHAIETIFYPLPLKDALEFLPKQNIQSGLQFNSSGLSIEGDADNNLCIKAYNLLKADFPQLPFLQIHLHKTIPIGAGLGGGSADGAFFLKALNERFDLGISRDDLIKYALQLGSDCPFFIINKPCVGKGRGEELQPIQLDLSAYKLVLVNPGIHINTKWAFEQLAAPTVEGQNSIDHAFEKAISLPVEKWKDELVNDFEEPVFKAHPSIGSIKETFYSAGAVYASMSGSGSSVIGLFEKEKAVQFLFPSDHLIKIIDL